MAAEDILKGRLESLPTVAASTVPTPGDGPVLFANSSGSPTSAISAKTPDGSTVNLLTTTSATGVAIQSGEATIVDGETALIEATITAASRIVGFLKTPVTGTLTVKFAALDSDRVVGVAGAGGGFKLTALVAAGTINVADDSVLDWIVIG